MPRSQGGDPPSLRLLAPLRFPAASAKRAGWRWQAFARLYVSPFRSLSLSLSLSLLYLSLFFSSLLFSYSQPSLCPEKRRSRLSILSLISRDTASLCLPAQGTSDWLRLHRDISTVHGTKRATSSCRGNARWNWMVHSFRGVLPSR